MKFRHIYYGWVIVLIGFFALCMNALAIFGFGVFLKPLTEEFGWERGALSTAFSISLLIGGILSLFTGRLSDRYGPRILVTIAGLALGVGLILTSQVNSLWQLYLVWGFSVGIGISCSVIPIISSIPRWFTVRRGIALAIPAAGFSLGGVIGPIIIERLISAFDWQQAFIVIGILPLVIAVPLAQLMKREPEPASSEARAETEVVEEVRVVEPTTHGLPFIEMVRNRWFWLLGSMQFSFGFCTQMIIVHITPYGTDVGLSAITAASILSISSATGIFGNLLMGSLADRFNPRLTLSGCYITMTLSLVWLLFTREPWMFYIFAIVFGAARGGIAPVQTMVPAEMFGLKHLGSFIGAFLLFGTLGGVLGTPAAGFIFDASGSYSLAFWLAIIFGTLACVVSMILLRYKTEKI